MFRRRAANIWNGKINVEIFNPAKFTNVSFFLEYLLTLKSVASI